MAGGGQVRQRLRRGSPPGVAGGRSAITSTSGEPTRWLQCIKRCQSLSDC